MHPDSEAGVYMIDVLREVGSLFYTIYFKAS